MENQFRPKEKIIFSTILVSTPWIAIGADSGKVVSGFLVGFLMTGIVYAINNAGR